MVTRRPGAAIGCGGGATAIRSDDLKRLHLVAPALEQLVGVEAQVDGVVAQEALGVDRRRQVVVCAVLERRQVAQPDLGVALGAVQVDALALAGKLKRLADGRCRSGIDWGLAPAESSAADAKFAARSHEWWSDSSLDSDVSATNDAEEESLDASDVDPSATGAERFVRSIPKVMRSIDRSG